MAEQAPRGPQSEPTTYNLLFICTGNTCRSPLAEAIARREVGERGWAHVSVQSAGIAAVAGAPASGGARRIATEHGLDLAGHASQPLSPALMDWADLVLVMSPAHLVAAADFGAEEKVALVTDFLEGEGLGAPIEDPFGGDDRAYRRAFDELEEAIGAVLSRLEPILAP